MADKSPLTIGSSVKMCRVKEAFLETIFYGIGQFLYDPVKEIIEKEKEDAKIHGTYLLNLYNILIEFVNAEKLYFSLSYIERRVLRRDVVRPLYDRIQTDLKKFEGSGDIEGIDVVKVLAHDLTKQLSQFVSARKEMIDFYVKMAKSRWDNKECDEQLVKYLENIGLRHENEFHHPLLDSLKTSFSLEIEIVQDLFKAELELQQWNYFQSLLHLFQCQANLHSWTQLVPPNALRELAAQAASRSPLSIIMSRKNWHPPFLYQWLYQKHLAVISKFSLYFHTTLSSQTNQSEMKAMTSKTTIDYFAKISTFMRKTDAHCVSLVLDSNCANHISPGDGYFMPNVEREKPTGLDTYPAIVSFLEAMPASYRPNIVSLLSDRSSELAQPGRIVYHFEERGSLTHYLIKVDVQIYLVIIFNGKRKEKDSYVQKFMTEMRSLLCYEKHYQQLKPRPGQKFRK